MKLKYKDISTSNHTGRDMHQVVKYSPIGDVCIQIVCKYGTEAHAQTLRRTNELISSMFNFNYSRIHTSIRALYSEWRKL